MQTEEFKQFECLQFCHILRIVIQLYNIWGLNLCFEIWYNIKKERRRLDPAFAPVEDVVEAHPRDGYCITLFHR